MYQPDGSGDHPTGPVMDFDSTQPPLNAAPLYLPNLIAGIVAAIGIVGGSIGTWASVVGEFPLGGMDIPGNWGVITLILGAICAIASFAQLNWGRTGSSLHLAVPLSWAVVVLAVSSLAIALAKIATVNSFSKIVFNTTHVAQVGWGLWLVAISSGVLCITAVIVAIQVGNASRDKVAWVSAWRWAAIAASAVILAVAIVKAYTPVVLDVQGQDTTQTETVTARPATSTVVVGSIPEPEAPVHSPPDALIPADAKPCSSNAVNTPFANSKAGTDVTSCPFAEAVREQYISQPLRETTVIVNVVSPVTNKVYPMTCRGNHVVICTGGTNAVIYLY